MVKIMYKQRLLLGKIMCLAALLFSMTSTQAKTDTYTIVVPYSVGGASDLLARTMQPVLEKELGKPVVVLNKPSAGGVAGTDYVINQKDPGNILIHSSSIFLSKKLGIGNYDVKRDLTLVGYLGYQPFILVSSNNFPHKDNIQGMKKMNVGVSFANGGYGSSNYLAAKSLQANFPNINFIDVSYGRGGAELIPNLISGNVDIALVAGNTFKGLIDEKKIYPIAVADTKRVWYLPNVKTLSELGVTNDFIHQHNFLYVSSKIDKEDADAIKKALAKIMTDSAFLEQLKQYGLEVRAKDINNFDKIADSELDMINKSPISAK